MRSMKVLAALLVSLSFGATAQEIPGDGSPVTIVLPAGPSGGNVFVDVPAGSRQLKISVTGDAGTDVGVLARFGGAFDLGAALGSQIEFLSVGPDHTEHLTISRASQPALRAGRWWLAVINWDDTPNSLEVSAVVSDDPELDPLELEAVWDSREIDDATGFWDAAPFSSPNNPAQTLGEARRLALEEALRIASENLTAAGVTSPVPVMIAATFEDLGGFEDDLATLATARAFAFFLSDSFFGLHQAGTWYPTPLIAKQVGTDMCRTLQFHVPPDDDDGSFEPVLDCNTPDALLTFNSHEDINWSYALGSVSHPADFVSTAMHEVMHGLGFTSLLQLEDDELEAGELEGGFADVYTRNLAFVQDGAETPLVDLDNAGRLQAATSVSGLRWMGQVVADRPGNPFSNLGQLFAMYAPAEVRPGSSVSHVNDQQPVPASELMRPTTGIFSPRQIGNSAAFMLDMGWGGGVSTVPDGHPIHFGMSGLWYNQATSGQGILLDVAATQDPPQVAAFWFTFADEAGGPEGQRWYTAQGDYSEGDSGVEMTVHMTTGGEFDRRPPVPEITSVGVMTLAFQSCTEAMLSYDFNLDNDPERRAQGVVPLTRLSPDTACGENLEVPGAPDAPITPPRPFRINFGLNGVWRERATSGQGLLFDVVETQDPPQVVALWFTFADAAGGAEGQRWFIAQGDYSEGDRSVALEVRMSLGGEFDRRPPASESVTVGEAVLEFGTGLSSCTQATLSYAIAMDGDAAQARSGEIALERVTPDILCQSFFDR